MKRQFLLRLLSASFGRLIVVSAIFVSSISSMNAQIADVYFHLGTSYTEFLRKDEIKIDKGLLSFQTGGGVSFFLNEEALWKIKTEFKYAARKYDTSFPESTFRLRAMGLELNSLVEYSFSEKFSLESGLGVYFYTLFLFENSAYRRLGDQDKTIDINLMVGASYQLYKPIFVGFRTSLGLIPMVKTRIVNEYGDLKDEQHLLNALTPELFLRIKLYRRNAI